MFSTLTRVNILFSTRIVSRRIRGNMLQHQFLRDRDAHWVVVRTRRRSSASVVAASRGCGEPLQKRAISVWVASYSVQGYTSNRTQIISSHLITWIFQDMNAVSDLGVSSLWWVGVLQSTRSASGKCFLEGKFNKIIDPAPPVITAG